MSESLLSPMALDALLDELESDAYGASAHEDSGSGRLDEPAASAAATDPPLARE
jgi:hypothetical protein